MLFSERPVVVKVVTMSFDLEGGGLQVSHLNLPLLENS